jgi:hypothetical protein
MSAADEVAKVSRKAMDGLGNGGFLRVLDEGPPALKTDALLGSVRLRPIENR